MKAPVIYESFWYLQNAAAANEQSKGPILSASDHEDDTLMSDHEADNSSAVISAPLGN